MTVIDAGRMRDRITRLQIAETDAGFAWQEDGMRHALAEWPAKRSVFSSVAMSARAVKLTMRRDDRLTLRHALRLQDGRHLFLTQITPEENRLYMVVEAAVVRLSDCSVKRTKKIIDPEFNRVKLDTERTVSFPAVLSERYLQDRQTIPQLMNTERMVLTCPKVVDLNIGESVMVDGAEYIVLVAHELDPDRNDYEVQRKIDA